jgi:hypothetical protein
MPLLVERIDRWIEKFTGGTVFSTKKHNELVDRLNPLLNIQVRTGAPRNEVQYSQRSVVIWVAVPIWDSDKGAEPASVGCYVLQEFLSFELLRVRTWDGVAPGADDIYIATPTDFRSANTHEVIPTSSGGTMTVDYTGYNIASQARSANNGSISEVQQITKPYLTNHLIYAISAPTFITDPFGEAVTLIDLNVDGRAWAVPENT